MNFRSYDTINSAMTTTPVTNQFQHMHKSILSPESGNLQGCTDFVHSQMMYCSPFHARHIKRIGMERVSTICHSWKVIVFAKGVICGTAKAITLLLHMWVTRYTVWAEYFKSVAMDSLDSLVLEGTSTCSPHAHHKTLTIWSLQAMVDIQTQCWSAQFNIWTSSHSHPLNCSMPIQPWKAGETF